MARTQKTFLLKKRTLGHKGPAAGKDGAHTADPAIEQIKQRYASADVQAAQQVMLPAEGEEGVDEGHVVRLFAGEFECTAYWGNIVRYDFSILQ